MSVIKAIQDTLPEKGKVNRYGTDACKYAGDRDTRYSTSHVGERKGQSGRIHCLLARLVPNWPVGGKVEIHLSCTLYTCTMSHLLDVSSLETTSVIARYIEMLQRKSDESVE